MTDLKFGLIGFPLANTFSVDYFTNKFYQEGLPYSYHNFELRHMEEITQLWKSQINLRGLNVTKPYKTEVIPYLDELAESASACGAVNCIEFKANGKRIGHNTDTLGFMDSLLPFLGETKNLKALVLGDGGAAKAVVWVLKKLSIPYQQISRKANDENGLVSYSNLNAQMLEEHRLIIQTTNLGMYPETEKIPEIPFESIGPKHFCYDLIYLPEKTRFLLECEKRSAKVKNGLEMLHLQANHAYEIWKPNLNL